MPFFILLITNVYNDDISFIQAKLRQMWLVTQNYLQAQLDLFKAMFMIYRLCRYTRQKGDCSEYPGYQRFSNLIPSVNGKAWTKCQYIEYNFDNICTG